jgi:hypothetical protein
MHPFSVRTCKHTPSRFEITAKVAIFPLTLIVIGAVAGGVSIQRRFLSGAFTSAICATAAIVSFTFFTNGGGQLSLMELASIITIGALAGAALGVMGTWIAHNFRQRIAASKPPMGVS